MDLTAVLSPGFVVLVPAPRPPSWDYGILLTVDSEWLGLQRSFGEMALWG